MGGTAMSARKLGGGARPDLFRHRGRDGSSMGEPAVTYYLIDSGSTIEYLPPADDLHAAVYKARQEARRINGPVAIVRVADDGTERALYDAWPDGSVEAYVGTDEYNEG